MLPITGGKEREKRRRGGGEEVWEKNKRSKRGEREQEGVGRKRVGRKRERRKRERRNRKGGGRI